MDLVYGQEKKIKNTLVLKPEFSANIIIPYNIGENYLAKSNKPNIGIGAHFNPIHFHDFKLGIGLDYISNSITDISKGGNICASVYNSIFGIGTYKIKISKEYDFQPFVGIGTVKLKLKTGNRSYGYQSGSDFRIGGNLTYKLDKTISAFGGICYVTTKYDVNTSPEYISFYNHSKTLQINMGIKINLGK